MKVKQSDTGDLSSGKEIEVYFFSIPISCISRAGSATEIHEYRDPKAMVELGNCKATNEDFKSHINLVPASEIMIPRDENIQQRRQNGDKYQANNPCSHIM